MRHAFYFIAVSVLLVSISGCGAYRLQPSGSVATPCGSTVGVAPIENMTPYHEQGALIRSALIDAVGSVTTARYQSDAACVLQCRLDAYASEVERRDTNGNPLSYRERFTLKCALVQERFTVVHEQRIDYTDAPFVSIDHRTAHERLARYIWKSFE
ncbi:hypothetical protein [Chrysiogenes arsenatis]|uniref:hypothetical protein n=1 Tax=Chrysiogenes arsenatis TaxID=309797 RepID=UPI00040917C5|nr:hypothetical protein [Chrysiogenes arsenatis]